MSTQRVIDPKWGDPFVDNNGVPLPRPQGWIDSISRIGNGLNDRITQNESDIADHETRITALEPRYVTKDNADSPYTAANMDYITADMSAGDISITLPATGRVWVSRDGASNTLTLTGTINGVANPAVLFDGTTVALWHNGTEWRYA